MVDIGFLKFFLPVAVFSIYYHHVRALVCTRTHIIHGWDITRVDQSMEECVTEDFGYEK